MLYRRQLGQRTNRNNNNAQRGNGSPAPSPTSYTGNNGLQQLPSTSSLSSQQSLESQPDEPPKFFFKEKYATLILKGNFMTLAAQPKNVELGEWLAHQSELNSETPRLKGNSLMVLHQSLNSTAFLVNCYNSLPKSIPTPVNQYAIPKPAPPCTVAGMSPYLRLYLHIIYTF